MYQTILTTLTEWNRTNSDRSKLQSAYVCLVVTLIVLAGVVGLVNDSISAFMLQIVFAVAVVWAVNAVSWALLTSFLLERLPKTVRKNTK